MPICPGCERTIPYGRLDTHERYCDGIWGSDRLGSSSVERLERRFEALERRLDRRIRTFEADVERQLVSIERARQSRRTARDE